MQENSANFKYNLTVCVLGFILQKYENTEQIFYASAGRDFCDSVACSDWTGMDVANYVHDEIFVELWGGINKFLGAYGTYGAVYHVYYYPVRYVHCGDFCL